MVAPFRVSGEIPAALPRGCVCCGQGRLGWCLACRSQCEPPPEALVPLLGPVTALVAYEGAGAQLVTALKHRDGRRAVPVVAADLAAQIGDVGPHWVVCWAPTSPGRRRRRGYDQSELLARAVARRLGVPCAAMLDRTRDSRTQTGATRLERLDGVAFVPSRTARRLSPQPDGGVVVIDDVCTTGATLRAAVTALAGLGWPSIRPVAVARTP